ncbi:MAG TPA: biotin/lipoyl-binding protein, partial [Gammaproteobacteria bacterium]
MPQVKGRVIEVPVEGNKLYKKGEVLFRIDPTPYELDVKSLAAQLAEAEGQANQLREQLKSAAGNTGALRAQQKLAQLRVTQNRELVSTGAGSQFDLDKAEADLANLESQVTTALANEAQVRAQLAAIVDGDQASVARLKADLAKSRWELEQTVTHAPADGYVINLQLRPGSMVVPFPVAPAMSFVEEDYQVIALYHQNELHQVAAGNEAEIALITKPGAIIKAHVNSIVWAQGQGQMPMSGIVPQTGTQALPPGRFAVKLDIDPKHRELFLAAGAAGQGAIYTDSMHAIHIIRKVILRVGSYTNYLILKMH